MRTAICLSTLFLILAGGIAGAQELVRPDPPLERTSEGGTIAPDGALPQRTFVASSGSDANPCTRSMPCRGFQAAIAAVAPGGEVVALDSAGYGPFTIDKSVSISAEGVHAAITAMDTNAIAVAVGTDDVVTLRNLRMAGLGGLPRGVRAFSLGLLTIEGCSFDNMDVSILVDLTTPGTLQVSDAVISNAFFGVFVQTTVPPLVASVSESRISGFSVGIVAGHNSRVTVTDTVAIGGSTGFSASNSNSRLVVERSVSTGNSVGISSANSGNAAYVSESTITYNATGLATSGGAQMISFGNNRFAENVSDGAFTSTIGTK